MAEAEFPPWQDRVDVGLQSEVTRYTPKASVRSFRPFIQGVRALVGRGGGLTINVTEMRGIVTQISAAGGSVYMGQNAAGRAEVFGQGVVKSPTGDPVPGIPVTGVLDGQEQFTENTDANGAVPFNFSFSEEGEHVFEMYVGGKPTAIQKRSRFYSSILFVVYRLRLTGVANPDPWLRYNGRAIAVDLQPAFWSTQLWTVIGLIAGSFTVYELLPVLKGGSVKFTYGNSADALYDGQPQPEAWWDCTISTKKSVAEQFVQVASGRVNRRNYLTTYISY